MTDPFLPPITVPDDRDILRVEPSNKKKLEEMTAAFSTYVRMLHAGIVAHGGAMVLSAEEFAEADRLANAGYLLLAEEENGLLTLKLEKP